MGFSLLTSTLACHAKDCEFEIGVGLYLSTQHRLHFYQWVRKKKKQLLWQKDFLSVLKEHQPQDCPGPTIFLRLHDGRCDDLHPSDGSRSPDPDLGLVDPSS